MPLFLKFLVSCFYILLAACGGGGSTGSEAGIGSASGTEGSGGSTSISLSTRSLSLNLLTGAESTEIITATFEGDGVILGTPGDSDDIPDWLTVKNTGVTTNTATFELLFRAPQIEGVYTTTLRLLTGFEDSEDFSYKDVSVTLVTVAPIDLAFEATYGQLATPDYKNLLFTENTLPQGSRITIKYQNSAFDGWLEITENESGFIFSALTTQLDPGEHIAHASFLTPSSQEVLVRVSYTINEPVFSFSAISDIAVGNRTNVENFAITTAIENDVNSFHWQIIGNSSLVTAEKNQNADGVLINVDHSELRALNNRLYEQWVEIQYGLVNKPQNRILRVSFNLDINFADEPAIQFSEVGSIAIDNGTTSEDLLTQIGPLEGGYFLTWGVGGQSDLITVEKNQVSDGMKIIIDKNKLNDVNNGSYEQWVDVLYTVAFSTQPYTVRVEFNIEKALISIKSLTPRVIYSGTEAKLRVWGDNLTALSDEQLLLTNDQFEAVTHINENEVELTLSSTLGNGEYELSIDNVLGFDTSAATLIVKSSPSFPVSELILPNRISNAIYDADRESFYLSTVYGGRPVYSLKAVNDNWSLDALTIDHPGGFTLTNDGSKLIVGNTDCNIYQVALDSNLISIAETKEFCFDDLFDFVGQFYTGFTILADTHQRLTAYSFPSWGELPFNLPGDNNPSAMMSQYNTHMLWLGSIRAHVYDVRSNTINTLATVKDGSHEDHAFSISAMGGRISHQDDIYNSQLEHIGTLESLDNHTSNRVGISPDGTQAAIYTYSDKQIKVFDISPEIGPFSQQGSTLSLNEESLVVDRIITSEDNRYLFVFTYNTNSQVSKMKVFEL